MGLRRQQFGDRDETTEVSLLNESVSLKALRRRLGRDIQTLQCNHKSSPRRDDIQLRVGARCFFTGARRRETRFRARQVRVDAIGVNDHQIHVMGALVALDRDRVRGRNGGQR